MNCSSRWSRLFILSKTVSYISLSVVDFRFFGAFAKFPAPCGSGDDADCVRTSVADVCMSSKFVKAFELDNIFEVFEGFGRIIIPCVLPSVFDMDLFETLDGPCCKAFFLLALSAVVDALFCVDVRGIINIFAFSVSLVTVWRGITNISEREVR